MTGGALEPRVFFRLRDGATIGPLGCFDVGEIVIVEGVEHVVTAVEPDGMAVAFRCDIAPKPQAHRSLSAVLRRLEKGGDLRFGDVGATGRQLHQIAAMIRGNRERAELPPVATEAVA